MGGKICLIIAQEGFRDEELFEPKDVFETDGYEVVIASPQKGECTGKLGGKVTTDLAISEINVADFEALVVVGGPGSVRLSAVSELQLALSSAVEQDKVIGAICLAPMVLAKFDLLTEKDATVFPTEDSLEVFKEKQVHHVKEDVVVDGKFVTANGPHASTPFAHMVVDVLHGLL